ncbi:MAG: hypothetical protein A2X86_08490 [Bdellovibrionales bacterium GWA2_49_15]|nr:MAG: hypothetical protein A2X86_08490 [Bdellovibrionales bacterium GWA2_49_15]HAZ11200.1 hypothetical protein [Bdellovibrionales bacterium]
MENKKKYLKAMRSLLGPIELEKVSGLYFASTRSGCGGISFEKEHAIISALGEGLERQALSKYNLRRLPFGSYQRLQMKHELLNPAELLLFSEAQYKSSDFAFTPFTAKTETHWVESREMLSGKKVFIPAPFIFLSYQKKEGCGPFIIPTSSGTACHGSFEAAALSALYELIERDAVVGMWDKKFSPPKITLPLEVKRLVNKIFCKEEEAVTFFNLQSDLGIPVVLAHCRGPGFSTFGSACHFNSRKALEKAMLECFQTSYAAKGLLEDGQIKQKPENEINDFIDHLLFYVCEEHQEHLKFLDQGAAFPSLPKKRRMPSLQEILKIFAKRDLGRVYFADITPIKIKAAGLTVVRAICPRLIQLNVGSRNRYLANPRIFSWKQFGRRGKVKNLNSKPHPFA